MNWDYMTNNQYFKDREEEDELDYLTQAELDDIIKMTKFIVKKKKTKEEKKDE